MKLDQKGREWWGIVASSLGEVGERGKIKSTAASSWLRASMGACKTVKTKSTGGGARGMEANDVSRLMPSLLRSFKSPDVLRPPCRNDRNRAGIAPAAAGSNWPSRTLRALTHLTFLPGVRGPQYKTPQNLNFWKALSSVQRAPPGPRRDAASFFLSLFSKTQPNHWTKRMTSSRLDT